MKRHASANFISVRRFLALLEFCISKEWERSHQVSPCVEDEGRDAFLNIAREVLVDDSTCATGFHGGHYLRPYPGFGCGRFDNGNRVPVAVNHDFFATSDPPRRRMLRRVHFSRSALPDLTE